MKYSIKEEFIFNLLAFLLWIGFVYLLSSFICWSFNPANWYSWIRVVSITYLFLLFMYYTNETIKKIIIMFVYTDKYFKFIFESPKRLQKLEDAKLIILVHQQIELL